MTLTGVPVPQFAARKAAAAIGYLVQRTGADLYSVMKMLYLADKVHLENYGRTIAGDVYVAMEKGPVPDRAYNLCKFVRGDRDHFDALPEARQLFQMRGYAFELLVDPDLDELSRSDLSALDEAAEVFLKGGFNAVYSASHDGAWQASWEKAKACGSRMTNMDFNAIASTLPNGAALIEFLADPHPGEAPNLSSDC